MNNYFDAEIFKPFDKESLQYRTLAAYIKFHKEDADRLSLLYKDRMTSQGNPLFKALSKDMKNLVGNSKKVSNQTLWRLFFENDYFPTPSKVKDIEDYIKVVDRVIIIRKLKANILKKFSEIHPNEEFSLSSKDPDTKFTAQLVRDVKKFYKGGNISGSLDKDIPKLFLVGNKEHEVPQETIDDLTGFIKVETGDKNSKTPKNFFLINLIKQNFQFIIGGLVVILLGVFIFIDGNKNFKPPKISNSSEPLFDEYDMRYRIMIIPFDEECEYQGSMKDIGKVIELRLEQLNKKDSLNIHVRYVPEFVVKKEKKDSSWEGFFKRIARVNNADQLIYGAIREENCTNSGLDEICINYVFSGQQKWVNKLGKTGYNFQPASRGDLTQGKLQGDIDFHIYMNAFFSLDINKYDKKLSYINKIIDSMDISQKNELLARFERMSLLKMDQYSTTGTQKDAKFILRNEFNEEVSLYMKIQAKFQLNDSTVKNDLDDFVKSEPDLWFAYLSRGHYYGRTEDSLRFKDYNKAIGLAENNDQIFSIYYTIAAWYHDRNYLGKSIEWSTRALNIEDDGNLRLWRAIGYYSLGSYKSALTDIDCALWFNSNDLRTLMWAARAHFMNGNWKYSRDLYSKIINLDPTIIGYFNVIFDLIQSGEDKQALKFIDEAFQKFEKIDPFIKMTFIYGKYICNKRLGNFEISTKNSLKFYAYPIKYRDSLLDMLYYKKYTFQNSSFLDKTLQYSR